MLRRARQVERAMPRWTSPKADAAKCRNQKIRTTLRRSAAILEGHWEPRETTSIHRRHEPIETGRPRWSLLTMGWSGWAGAIAAGDRRANNTDLAG
jgi:hypothetical protein